MLVWLRHLPAESATATATDPDAMWGPQEHLLAGIYDTLTWANYQRAEGKGPKPKPLPRPGVKDDRRRVGQTDLPPDEAREILRGYVRGHYATEGGSA